MSHISLQACGGRKSIIPGVAGAKTIIQNHCPRNIASKDAVIANLDGNPINNEFMEALAKSPLHFILNVALDSDKRIIAAFAGHPDNAHRAGCAYVKENMMALCTPRTHCSNLQQRLPAGQKCVPDCKGH